MSGPGEGRPPDVPATVRIRQEDDLVVVSIEGDMDQAAVPGLRDRLVRVNPAAVQVVIDLSLVTFFDSTAIGLMIGLRNQAAGRRPIAVVAPQAYQRRMLALAGLERVFVVRDTLVAVRRALAEWPVDGAA
jgi:anti-anti-sigma factor